MIALYKYRCEANLTQKQLALQLGVTTGCAFNLDCANAKEKAANLYFEYGMRVICDMQETAKRMQEIEDEQRLLRLRLDRLKDEANELASIKVKKVSAFFNRCPTDQINFFITRI